VTRPRCEGLPARRPAPADHEDFDRAALPGIIAPGRRLIDRLTISALLVGALAAACSGDGLQSQDGLHLHLRWSVMFNDQPSTCAEAKVARVAVLDLGEPPNEFGSWPCESLEGTTGSLTTAQGDLGLAGSLLFAPAFDASGVRLTPGELMSASAEFAFPEAVRGVVEMPDEVLLVTDEPLAELHRLFSAASDYYKAHGQLPPSSAGWAPGSAGRCCAFVLGACTPDPSYWAASPWRELAFSIDHRFYFGYNFTALSMSPPTFLVEAGADLACTGGRAAYSITGTWNGTLFTGIDQVTKMGRL